MARAGLGGGAIGVCIACPFRWLLGDLRSAMLFCGKTGMAICGHMAAIAAGGKEAGLTGVEVAGGRTTSSGSWAFLMILLAMRGLLISDRSIPPGV